MARLALRKDFSMDVVRPIDLEKYYQGLPGFDHLLLTFSHRGKTSNAYCEISACV